MNILLGTSAFCDRDEATTLLLQANISPTEILALENEQALNHAGELLENNAANAIVLYAPLEWVLQQATEQGFVIEQALVTWQQNASQLIRFYKQHRTRVLLANFVEVFSSPRAFADACANRWPELTVNCNESLRAEAKPDPFYQLLAYAIQSQAPALQTLGQQLAALSQPLAEHSPEHSLLPVDINQLVTHYQNAISVQQQLPGLLEKQAINQVLLNELKEKAHHQQQLAEQERQAYSQEKQEWQSQNTRLQEQLNSLQQAHNQTRQKQDELQQENQLLLEQLFAVQEALESRTLEHEKQRAQHQQQQEQLNGLQQVHNQTRQKQDELQQENQQLLEQLFTVQEALESRTLEYEKQRAQHQQQQQAYNKEQQELYSKITQQQEQLNSQQQVLNQAKNEQNELQQENQLLLEQLFSVQEEFENYFISSAQKDHQPAVSDTPAVSQSASNEKVSVLKQQFQKRAEQKALKRKLADLYNSSLFDAKWYLAQYPDVANDKKFRKNPALHYLRFGGFEGRNPGPNFDSATYLLLNPDVKAEGFNPLLHYLRFGQAENRRTS
ncbi:hypothetical protein [Oceanimonas doudoroffii]|uniref:Uncharacterized protein n=1 Tax=Oceanimonas doudoroffii TaxID=84158 RepID=A0A233RFE0_9GAMM|nr:hypothetical protein [Oceanimonas doudoroffii]OXY82107.1 hypothetical protein B6S08_00800 [Oceanimonas doudoroffii]